MPGISETCSVCTAAFDVQFRYQMEERDGGFSFYCSQRCLEKSQLAGGDAEGGTATCDACAKRFRPDLAAQVLYLGGKRRYACSLDCRGQLQREASGARLGDIAAAPPPTPAVAEPAPLPGAIVAPPPPASRRGAVDARPPSSARSGTREVVAPVSVASRAQPNEKGTPRTIAVFNHKGGTGKTTTAVTIAAGLAQRGKRVLLVDTDAQGNVAVSLGAACDRTLYHVLVMGLRVADAARPVRPNLDLLPSNETLAAAELYLAGRQNRDRVLSDRLAQGSAGYDYVVLDCSPSLSLMNQNALVFADSVLVPVACDYLSLVGVRQVIKTVKNVNALLHHPVQIWGVLPTFYDARANICREAVTTLKSHFGDRCLAPVRAAIKVKEAPAQGQTLFEYAAGSNAADDYAAVVDAIVEARAGKAPRAATEPARRDATAQGASASA
ncbi:MAG TPA: ParA family protein [Byssovorax sp.]|jgi:chromosome partitioning protein